MWQSRFLYCPGGLIPLLGLAGLLFWWSYTCWSPRFHPTRAWVGTEDPYLDRDQPSPASDRQATGVTAALVGSALVGAAGWRTLRLWQERDERRNRRP